MIKNYDKAPRGFLVVQWIAASILPLQGMWVGSLVRDLRYHKSHDMARKTQTNLQ